MENKTVIAIKGGLGNQLFQYAHGLKLSIIDKADVVFDTSFFETDSKDTSRPFLLDKFNISSFQFVPIKESIFKRLHEKIQLKLTGDYKYFQSEKYFVEVKDEVRKQFTLKNPLSPAADEMMRNIQAEKNSVALHIRRGDYATNTQTNSFHGLCDLQYYYEAVAYFKSKLENPLFFIFSDDIQWVKNNLHMERNIFVSNPNILDYEELALMSACSHNIIANSSFSWWGAYLNPNFNKIVIAPKQWTNKKTSNELEILPKEWIQM